MTIEKSIFIAASPSTIFALYADMSNWPTWDPDVRAASLNGPFASGTSGKLKPSSGPESRIMLSDVAPNRAFTIECRLPLCVMRFRHELTPSSDGTTARHAVSFQGLLAPVFSRLMAKTCAKGCRRPWPG